MHRRLALLAATIFLTPAAADDWPQWLGPKRDGVWRETGIIDKFPEGGPPIVWRAPVSGGFTGPAVADGRVYVADYMTADNVKKEVYDRTDFKGKERLHCLDAKTGKELWKHEYDCRYTVSYPIGPRCTPTVAGGKVYFLGTEGNLTCLDAAKGTPVWAKDFKTDYGAKTAIWGYASHPLVDGQLLYCVVGGEGSCVVAFDKDTGKEVWKALTAQEQGYCPPTMIEAGGTKQLLVWHATSINGLDPATGKKHWSVPIEADYKMSIMTPRKNGDLLYVAGEGAKGVMIRLAADKPDAKEVWRGKKTNGLYPINMTPWVEDGYMYGVDQTGHLRCVKTATGERVWESAAPFDGKPANAGTAFIVKNGDRFFLFTEKGDLIIAKLTPEKYEEVSRAKLLAPTLTAFGRSVVWSHPAFADGCVFARNDKEIVCYSLKK
ncbi:MAG TPA: PQQ-binding-like beta-propeller repeat protein [Gemmataceae bacterium]|nr:PQQ-binding-like beta-propeller repeat protein [Gemmataceae bacterium]